MNILLVGSEEIGSLAWYCMRALEKIGHEVEICDYPFRTMEGSYFEGFLDKIIHPILFRKFEKDILEKATIFKPELLLAIKGDKLNPRIIRKIKKMEIVTANWFPDIFEFYPISLRAAKAYDYFFIWSSDLVKRYGKMGINTELLPFACDEDLHKSLKLSKKDREKYGCDVSFIGTMYEIREKILTKLVSSIPSLDLKIFGNGWEHANKTLELCWEGKAIYGEEMTKANNASKITLNIHQYFHENYGLNMRVFEATGCGAFHITDYRKDLDEYFRPSKEIVSYDNKKELSELVNYYLENEEKRTKIARNGQEKSHSEHTYIKRMKKMISIVSEGNE